MSGGSQSGHSKIRSILQQDLHIKNVLKFIAAFCIFVIDIHAEALRDIPKESSENSVYTLPVAITERALSEKTGDVITQNEMERDNVHDLWEAVRYTPGIILSGGGRRNDSSFTLRGFGADSVPVFVDGMIMTSPYMGRSDAARVLTGDLESVTIQKGYSSRLLGANTLGGAVLMQTAKPKRPLEARFDATVALDSVYKKASEYYLGSFGSKEDLFYIKGTLQYRDIDHFRLSDDFEISDVNPQPAGDRLFSDSTDSKVTLVGGFTPTDTLDIWMTYIFQEADKGVSSPETTIQDYVIWDWTKWRRESVSLASSYKNGSFELGGMVHYDKYDNALNEYYSIPSYQAGVHAPTSIFDEYTAGGRITSGWRLNESNRLESAVIFQRQKHSGFKEKSEEIMIVEDTFSVGMEYTYTPFSNLTLVAGIGYDELEPRDFWSKSDDFADWIGSEDYAVNPEAYWLIAGQMGLFYEWIDGHELRATYARKNRFPTMMQRYSTRYGRELPNPNLRPEVADHFELGYKGKIGALNLDAALYYSNLQDKIVTLEVPNPSHPAIPVDYFMNLNEVAFYGFELGIEAFLNEYTTGGVSFSLNRYEMGATADRTVEVIPYYPEHTASGYIVIAPTDKLMLIPRVEYVDSRYPTIEKKDVLPSYFLANFKMTYDFDDYFSCALKIDNILDENYEIREFFPQSGRTFSLTFSARY